MYTNLLKDWTCSSKDVLADRQTHRQINTHTNMLIKYFSPNFVFQSRSRRAEWSTVRQYEDKTWHFRASWAIIVKATEEQWTPAPPYRHQSTGSRRLAWLDLLADRRHLWRITSAKRCTSTFSRYRRGPRFRHTPVPRCFCSLTRNLQEQKETKRDSHTQ